MNRIVWFIRNVDFKTTPLDAVIGVYGTGIGEVERGLSVTLSAAALEAWESRTRAMIEQGTPADLARRLAAIPDLVAAPDVVLVAQRTGRPVADIASTHFAVEGMFQLGTLIGAAREIAVSDYFDRLALDRAIDSIASAHRNLVAEAVARGPAGPEAVKAWSAQRGTDVTRIRAAVDTIVSSGLTLSKVTVAASLLGDLARA
jgi:glutamate dehydrogenase